MVFPRRAHSFTLEIESDSVNTTDQPNWILIGNETSR